ncbi:MAG: hypothetical protein MUE65_07410 [Methanomassiliicoccales archaeon]|nr:hypothetical protein [Methanomassiliicoccales archaeon]
MTQARYASLGITRHMAKKGERGRCVTGVEGLDNILGGGIPTSSIVLVAGACGTGKTSLGLEFLVRGVMAGEPGLLITTVEGPDKLLSNVPRFILSGSDLDEAAIKKLVAALAKQIAAHRIKRLVIDTIDTVLTEIKDDALDALLLGELSEVLFKNECTALLVSSSEKCERIEGRVADGIVMMGNLERKGDLLRTMQVVKMKGTSHSRSKYVVDLTDAGVLVTPLLKGGL